MTGMFTEYMRVHDAISDVYDDEGADQWLITPNYALGGHSPHEALIHGKYADVMNLIDRLAGGPRV